MGGEWKGPVVPSGTLQGLCILTGSAIGGSLDGWERPLRFRYAFFLAQVFLN